MSWPVSYAATTVFANDGGPLIVLPLEAVPHWRGVGSASDAVSGDEGAFEPGASDDYDRACEVSALAALLPVGPSWGIVLGGEVPVAQWIRLREPEALLLAVTLQAEDPSIDATVRAYLEASAMAWSTPTDLAATDALVFMHAASPGHDVSEALQAAALPGEGIVVRASPPTHRDFAAIGDAVAVPVAPVPMVFDFGELELPDGTAHVFHRFRPRQGSGARR